jgi:phosphoenolpyruvate carboxylase
MGILGAAGLAKEVGLHAPPLFEVILPMTESAEEMIAIQESFKELASLKHPLHNFERGGLTHIELIPLFEQVDVIIASAHILETYLALHERIFHFTPAYIRPYLARSDPALNSGLVPTVLAIKIALSRYQELEQRTGVRLYPIIGSACLPFRGGLTPDTVAEFCHEYRGIKTALLQSAFRYDFDKKKVLEAIRLLETMLPLGEAATITPSEEQKLLTLITYFEGAYQRTVEGIAPIIMQVASALPRRRERVQHIGLFGYSRSLGKVQLPRAIGFTGPLYSLGVPPELIGTGRGLKYAEENMGVDLLEKYYIGLRRELKRAGGFLCKEGLARLATLSPEWKEVEQDVQYIEAYLGERLGPVTKDAIEHANIVQKVHARLEAGESFEEYLQPLAVLRKSIG